MLVQLTDVTNNRNFYVNSDYVVMISHISDNSCNLLIDFGEFVTVVGSADDVATKLNACAQGGK